MSTPCHAKETRALKVVLEKIRRIEHLAKFLDQVGNYNALNRLDRDLQTVLDGRVRRI